MGKRNSEDLDQDVQERMLKEDSTAKIATEKDEKTTEVRISFVDRLASTVSIYLYKILIW